MITLYVNNFRGFKDTYIPLKDVNFFVGENSTGKTSILSLIELLSNSDFYDQCDFRSKSGFDLGHFQELTTESYFDIGFYRNNISDERNDEDMLSFMPSFIARFVADDDNAPVISKLIFDFDSFVASLQIKNRKRNIKILNEINKTGVERFQLLLKEHNSQKSVGYKMFDDGYIEDIERNNGCFTSIKKVKNAIAMYVRNMDTMSKNKVLLHLFFNHLMIPNLVWISPIRSKPERTYDRRSREYSPEGKHIPYILLDIEEKGEKKGKDLTHSMNRFGKESGLFNSVHAKKFGDEKNAPFEIQIEIDNDSHRKITNVGYGVSQALPIVIEILSRIKNTFFAIQQPEVHLHPKAQAAVGEFIHNQVIESNHKFVIETHSDFMIDRFRIAQRKSRYKVTSQVVYFERTQQGNKLTCLELDENGLYPDNQPESFREFFMNEAMALLEM